MQTRNQTIIPLTQLDIQRMVLEAVRRLRVPLNELAKKWNYETCYDEAKKYKSKAEFEKNASGACNVARRNGWLKDYTWFERPVVHNKKWNRETCREEAKKYKSRTEFMRGSGSAYQVALRNGWLDDYTWLKNRIMPETNVYIVYYYEDKETNAVYVGLTNNLKRRHRQHSKGMLKHGVIKYDIVYKYFRDTLGKEVPEPIVLHKDIYAKDAQEYEHKYIEQFKNEGKFVLNIAKAGSLGGYGKWSKEMCYSEAKKYKSRTEFARKNQSAYNAAHRNGWLDDYTWFEEKCKPSGYWNKETCYKEAKKYKTRKEFQVKSGGAYKVARKNGWLDDYTWFKNGVKLNAANRVKWNRETCYEEAKKYKSRLEFKKGSKGAYDAARKNGWLDDYDWLVKQHKSWDYDTCYEESKKYKSRWDFGKNSPSAYHVALKNGWLDTWFQKPSKQVT